MIVFDIGDIVFVVIVCVTVVAYIMLSIAVWLEKRKNLEENKK